MFSKVLGYTLTMGAIRLNTLTSAYMLFVKAIVLASLIILPRVAVAQYFHGQIGDNRTYKPLPEANIQVKDKPISCQVNPDGSFEIDLSAVSDTDTVLISCPGYTSKILLKQELIDAWYDIKLSPVKAPGLTGLNADRLPSQRFLKD